MDLHHSFSVAKSYRLIKSWKVTKNGNEENLELKIILLRKSRAFLKKLEELV